MIVGTDWASWGTAAGTLVLAVATFASVRYGNAAARNTERALQAGLRPILFASRPHETVQKVRWGDGHLAALPPGHAIFEKEDGVIYMAISLQNVGAGMAVILGWRIDVGTRIDAHASLEEMRAETSLIRPDSATFRPQTRDLYSPPGDLIFGRRQSERPTIPTVPRSRLRSGGRIPSSSTFSTATKRAANEPSAVSLWPGSEIPARAGIPPS